MVASVRNHIKEILQICHLYILNFQLKVLRSFSFVIILVAPSERRYYWKKFGHIVMVRDAKNVPKYVNTL